MTKILDLTEWELQEPTKSSNKEKIISSSALSTSNIWKQQKIQYEYAWFWLRFVAFIIDVVVMFIGIYIFYMILGNVDISLLSFIRHNYYMSKFFGFGVMVIYYSLMEASSKQATLWKQAMNIKVVDENGHQLTIDRAFVRNLSKWLSSFVLMIWYIMIAFTEKKQGLHDLIAKCLVVRKWTWRTLEETAKTDQIEEKLY